MTNNITSIELNEGSTIVVAFLDEDQVEVYDKGRGIACLTGCDWLLKLIKHAEDLQQKLDTCLNKC